jgi:hypothetical protein
MLAFYNISSVFKFNIYKPCRQCNFSFQKGSRRQRVTQNSVERVVLVIPMPEKKKVQECRSCSCVLLRKNFQNSAPMHSITKIPVIVGKTHTGPCHGTGG